MTVLFRMFQDIRCYVSLFNDVTPTVSKYWSGPVEMSTYTHSEIEAYSCVAGDVACNAAPAVISEAGNWSGTMNNP
ncbi:hypothetical protein GUITHDRAFT_110638 [Guillardia theta CCMP2712]|uniref:Uncharacterized protein n=1 Tax=Guillardia theta (strain CCMP2712) TaxID=905079 RepID=L1J4Q7_GUITC|nr:hypothetical protein GUITHDRAFT_110638 [Guillardia theta CCMP2712]EKX43518.1 hypothetical protein GUITHDRAFT_110638 [Guillardia theta CCMP2712]|eukprot:XP_005830498.1 hypothetical protein GUITHDRAFT_110638 [Guillardia theta CCMP2712]